MILILWNGNILYVSVKFLNIIAINGYLITIKELEKDLSWIAVCKVYEVGFITWILQLRNMSHD